MKSNTWIWGGDEAVQFDGHDVADADALRIARDEYGWDLDCARVQRLFVVRDPSKDGQGDADEAFRKCDSTTPGAVAVTLVTS